MISRDGQAFTAACDGMTNGGHALDCAGTFEESFGLRYKIENALRRAGWVTTKQVVRCPRCRASANRDVRVRMNGPQAKLSEIAQIIARYEMHGCVAEGVTIDAIKAVLHGY